MSSSRFGVLAAAALVASTVSLATPVSAHTTGIHDNCTNFNKRYPHGVGTRSAHDRVKGSTAPVTNFKRSNSIYWAAEHHNSDLDRDNDRVACEKH
jgi:Excalibur calcium-binding domain